MNRLVIDVLPGEYTVTRLAPGAPVPAGLLDADGFVSVTRTGAETSVVAPSAHAPDGERAEPGWRLLTVRGPLEFTLTGIMAALAGALAQAGVPLFAMSTFDTDHLLVRAGDLGRAVTALREAGHEIG
ncbi:ACT domain-containing protein [Actinokineospora sp. NPDC004072]